MLHATVLVTSSGKEVRTGCLKMRVRKMRVLDNASTLVSMENASTEYASTFDRPGKCEYGICEY